MVIRKFFSEYGLNMFLRKKVVLQQDGLAQIADMGIAHHIYLICRRPRIWLDPKSVVFTKERATGKFKKQVRDTIVEIPFNVPNHTGTDEVNVECEYPFTEFRITTKDGGMILEGKSANLMVAFGHDFHEHTALEVLYVGQSYGKEGARNAGQRLKTHETLQGIYSESIRLNPDQEIWLMLCSFEPIVLASFDGWSKNYEKSEEEDSEHTKHVLSTKISEQQKINFTEAAIIRYFQPEYNKTFKETFPSPAHSTYSECYDLDLNMVTVEIQTDDININLWSDAAPSHWVHFCTFPLHSREERMYMFDIS